MDIKAKIAANKAEINRLAGENVQLNKQLDAERLTVMGENARKYGLTTAEATSMQYYVDRNWLSWDGEVIEPTFNAAPLVKNPPHWVSVMPNLHRSLYVQLFKIQYERYNGNKEDMLNATHNGNVAGFNALNFKPLTPEELMYIRGGA